MARKNTNERAEFQIYFHLASHQNRMPKLDKIQFTSSGKEFRGRKIPLRVRKYQALTPLSSSETCTLKEGNSHQWYCLVEELD